MAKVELIYIAENQENVHFHFEFKDNTPVADLIKESEIWKSHPETKEMPIGIFSKLVSMDTILKPGDRVEIYRPLCSDPKEKRRQRA